MDCFCSGSPAGKKMWHLHLFMVISIDIGPPPVKSSNPANRFRVLKHYIIPVKIEPVVVGPASRPGFAEFPRAGIGIVIQAFCEVHPRGVPLHPVGIECRIDQDDSIPEQLFCFLSLPGCKKICNKNR